MKGDIDPIDGIAVLFALIGDLMLAGGIVSAFPSGGSLGVVNMGLSVTGILFIGIAVVIEAFTKK